MNTKKVMTILFVIYLGCVVIQHYQNNGLTVVKQYWEEIKIVTDRYLH